MKIIDVSWPITEESTGYKDAKDVSFKFTHDFDKFEMRKSNIFLSSHVGTHVDAPSHFLKDGLSIESIQLKKLVGKANVVDLSYCQKFISAEDLKEKKIEKNSVVLIKTKNSQLDPNEKFYPEFVSLDVKAAKYLVSLEVKAIGVDYLSIEKSDPEHKVHKNFMKNNIPIIEGLRLEKVSEGSYFFICLPLSIKGLEAAPARAVLISDLKI